ncbi:MAG TPA: Vms1/Ankzf1 family peptidyl-tRNA hydrolase [Mycobacteriales bacterium]|nr:Vms1/Ankzf1 family peptidyl-tRNA hydrolase [Mycobacteriales bacterium]
MDLHALAPLYRLTGPVVTWYLPVEPAEDTAAQREITWKNGLRELRDRQVDEATVAALAAVEAGSGGGAGTRVIVAADGAVQLDEHLPPPPISGELTVGSLPRLLPAISWLGSRRPHVVVLTDREGADVIAYPATGGEPVYEVSAQTAEWPVHKTGIGGWAAKRFDATVEESWERSAERVATLIDDVARKADPALVVGSGDERAITLLQDHLPAGTKQRFVVVPGGGRHRDGGGDEVARQVSAAVAAKAAAEEVDVLGRFGAARGRGEGAVEGVAQVVRALQQAQVATLLVSPGWHGWDRRLAFGPDPAQVAVEPSDLEGLGVDSPASGPLVDVAIRAALGTDADVIVVSADADNAPKDGLGALLRFDSRPVRPGH